MDHTQLLALGKDLVLLISPLVAQGALTKIGENAADAAQAVFARAWAAIRGRFAGDQDAEDALAYYQRKPADPARQQIVADQIVARFKDDLSAIAELQELVRALRAATGAPSPQRTHTLTIGDNAQVGTAISGDVHGGLTVGSIDFSRNKRTILAPPARITAPLQNPAISAARPALPATLSADGTHFSYGHALLIGVGAYQNTNLSAPTTANDARALAQLLRDPQVAAYPEAQVRMLTDAEATRAGILAALDAFAAQLATAQRPTTVIFFAGHGVQRGESFHLLPHDYAAADVAGTAISATTFHEKVAAIRLHAQKLIVLLNCCHAGGVGDDVLTDQGAEPESDAPPPAFYQPLVAGGGQVVVSSSRPWQKSGAVAHADPAHTTFGAQLLAALRGQAPGEAPGIGVFELFSHLSTHVPADARTITYRGKPLAQEPLLYAHQLDQNFAVALRPGWQGGTLEVGLNDLIQELAAIEVQLASYAAEAEAPANLVTRRDALLARLKPALA